MTAFSKGPIRNGACFGAIGAMMLIAAVALGEAEPIRADEAGGVCFTGILTARHPTLPGDLPFELQDSNGKTMEDSEHRPIYTNSEKIYLLNYVGQLVEICGSWEIAVIFFGFPVTQVDYVAVAKIRDVPM